MPIQGVLLGRDIAAMTDDALAVAVENHNIFARFSPDEKNRIITALQKNGHVVGYMGDGINDAPSLEAADVGISVNNAVDVAKQAADIILTKKDLGVLLDGIFAGRIIFGNSMKYILMGVSSNFGNMFSVIGAVMFLPYLPMLPIQILLNNLLYDISQMTIPNDTVDPEYIQKPKRWDMKFIKKFMITFGLTSSLFDFMTFALLYGIWSASMSVFQTGWFIESLATQTLIILIIRTRAIPFVQSWPAKSLLISTLAVVTIGWIIPITPLSAWLKFTPLPIGLLLSIMIIVAVYLLTVEFIKQRFYRRLAY
jgi:Mg2+-importing ATPase